MSEPGFTLAGARVAIAGLGLMGGSLALALRGRCAGLYAVDPDPAVRTLALERQIVSLADEDPARILPLADVVILAAPVPAILGLLARLPDLTPNPCIVMDLGSTKLDIVRAMQALPERFDPLGGHPICGKEHLSLANADAGLYQEAPFVLTPLERTTCRARSCGVQIVQAAGAHPLWMDPAEHDRSLAATSHLPFLVASALSMAVPQDAAQTIGPGFRSTARLAATPASMMLGILRTNRRSLLEALQRFQQQLSSLASALEEDDPQALAEALDSAQARYHSLLQGSLAAGPPPVEPALPTAASPAPSPSAPSLEITPIGHPLHASVRVPGSKSLTNRLLITAALAGGVTTLENALFSDDSRLLAEALQALGFDVRLDPEQARMTIAGQGGRIPAASAELYVGGAGTAARFLAAFLTLGSGEYRLDGSPRMRQRPMADLVEALTALGACIRHTGGASLPPALPPALPLHISSSGLSGGSTHLSGSTSSQFLSALLMAAPYARQPVEVVLTTELASRPYVELTLAVMADFGVQVRQEGWQRFSVPLGQYQPQPRYVVESDASAASYFFAAPAICGGTLRVENLTRRSKQGDLAFLDVLQQMGCTVEPGENSIAVTGASPLHGVGVDMADFPDTAQTLAVVAPFAASPTRIRGITSARLKETDRITAVCTELSRLGVTVEEHPDGMTIYPCQAFSPAEIHTYDDHRMAMAFALVGLRVPGVVIRDPGCVSKTFPGYFEVLESLRA